MRTIIIYSCNHHLSIEVQNFQFCISVDPRTCFGASQLRFSDFSQANFEDEDEDDDYIEDPYDDSLSAAIAESAALAERERRANQGESSTRHAKQKKIIKKDSYFSDEEDVD